MATILTVDDITPPSRVGSRSLMPWQSYLFAVVVTALALGARLLLLQDLLRGSPTLVLFTVPIMLSAYIGGLGGGMLATALSYLAVSYYLLSPIHSLAVASAAERWQLLCLALAGIVVSVLSEALHAARRRADLATRRHETAEKALHESEGRYRAIVDWSPQAVAVHRGGKLIFVNPAALAMFGAKSPHELLGRSVLDLIDPSSHAVTLARMNANSDHSAGTRRIEMKGVKLDGTPMTVETQTIPIIFNGEPAMLGALRDMSQSKAHELEIERLNRLYSALTHVDQAIVRNPAPDDLCQNVCRILVEHGGVRMAWIGRDDGEGRPLARVASWGDDGGYLASLPIGPKGRVWGVLNVYASEIGFFKDREIDLLTKTAEDIAFALDNHAREAERQRSNLAVQTAEERMRFALQHANVGTWDMDYATGVLEWSDISEAQYGLAPGTFNGTFEQFVGRIHPDDREAFLETVGKSVTAGKDFSVLHRTIWPDGTVHWLSGAGRILLDESGQPVRGIGISQDVTERHTLEEHFHQAQKMDAIGRLAGGIAHDFNNLLTVMLGHTQLLLADLPSGDPRQGELMEIQRAGTTAAELTRQLLAFSRKQIIEPTLLDLNAIVGELRAMLGRLIGEDVTILLRLEPHLAVTKADRAQVEQIVMNLVVNARDAMPGGGTLAIETTNVTVDEAFARTHLALSAGPYVMLAVRDTGTGMTPEVQARLFEPFFTTKAVGKGTGLGLATVHGIVARIGGAVIVHSEIGSGTSFEVYFPRAADAGPAKVAAVVPAIVPRSGTLSVLVVEDAPGIRLLARKMLTRQGFTVFVASNADEALQIVEENAVDLLLTDVVMPGMSGAELSRLLVARRPGLKILFMSGYTGDAIVQHGVLKPGVVLLDKPFTAEALARKIQEVLDG